MGWVEEGLEMQVLSTYFVLTTRILSAMLICHFCAALMLMEMGGKLYVFWVLSVLHPNYFSLKQKYSGDL